MEMVEVLQKSDEAVEQVAMILRGYEEAHEGSKCLVYRYNPASIRVKVVDGAFEGKSKGERHDQAWSFLDRLPEDVLAQISLLLCLAPGESSLLDAEFHDQSRSYL